MHPELGGGVEELGHAGVTEARPALIRRQGRPCPRDPPVDLPVDHAGPTLPHHASHRPREQFTRAFSSGIASVLYGAPPYSGNTQKTESHKDQGRRLGHLHEKAANLATGILGRMKINV